MSDEITESIRAIRHELAEKFDNDIQRIADDLRRQEVESLRTFVKHAPEPREKEAVTIKPGA